MTAFVCFGIVSLSYSKLQGSINNYLFYYRKTLGLLPSVFCVLLGINNSNLMCPIKLFLLVYVPYLILTTLSLYFVKPCKTIATFLHFTCIFFASNKVKPLCFLALRGFNIIFQFGTRPILQKKEYPKCQIKTSIQYNYILYLLLALYHCNFFALMFIQISFNVYVEYIEHFVHKLSNYSTWCWIVVFIAIHIYLYMQFLQLLQLQLHLLLPQLFL